MKKGFTLIELLAVIVILAVIALIATPMILGVIEKVRIGAAESSAVGYLEALENYQVMAEFTNESPISGTVSVSELNNKLNVKGEKPVSGTVTVTGNIITDYSLRFGDYIVNYDETSKKGVAVKADSQDTYNSYAVGDNVVIDNISYHVIKNSSTSEEYVTLLRDESIGEMKFDENGGLDYELSSLKTYLNSTYKETFGDKATYVKEITILDFGTWTFKETIEELAPTVSSIDGAEGTYAYLFKNGYTWLGTNFWTKSVINSNWIVTGMMDNITDGYRISMLSYVSGFYTSSYTIDGIGESQANIEGEAVRPVVVISKKALN